MWNSWGLACIGHENTFLAAKDGPPNEVSYPGWLGTLDLSIFTVGLVPALLGFFKVFEGDAHLGAVCAGSCCCRTTSTTSWPTKATLSRWFPSRQK